MSSVTTEFLLLEYLGLFVLLFGLLSVFIHKYFLLRLFISIEVVILGLVVLCVAVNFFYVASLKLVLCLAVCDAGVFLALIVSLIRRVGRDSVRRISSF